MLEKSAAPGHVGRAWPASTSTEPATGEIALDRRDRRCRGRGRRARAAWAGWAARPFAYRVETLRRFANVVRGKLEPFADLIARETGKPLWEARTEVEAVIDKVDISVAAYAERTAQRRLEGAMGARVARPPQAARRAGGARPL